MQHVCTAVPVKWKRWRADLGSWSLKVIGYRARCKCGYRSRLYKERRDALARAYEHVAGRVAV